MVMDPKQPAAAGSAVVIVLQAIDYGSQSKWRARLGGWLIKLAVRAMKLQPSVRLVTYQHIHFNCATRVYCARHVRAENEPLVIPVHSLVAFCDSDITATLRAGLHTAKN
jgi:hypothetical protein